MKSSSRVLVLFVAVLAVGIYLERDRLAPYTPHWLTAAVGLGGEGQSVDGRANSRSKAGRNASPVAVRVATADVGSLPVTFSTTGNVVAIASTVLNTETIGIVTDIAVKDGASVKAGDLIVQLDDRSAKAMIDRDQASVTKDQAALTDAQTSLDRIQSLVKSGASTRQSGDDAMAAVREAQASMSVDQAALAVDQVALSKTRIVAPFDGRLGAVSVSLGALVQPGTSIVTVTQVRPVYLQFTLPETLLAKAQSAMAKGNLSADAEPTLSYSSDTSQLNTPAPDAPQNGASVDQQGVRNGKVVFIDNAIDPASATFKLRAEMANADGGLLPGQSLDVDVRLGDIPDLVLVPSVAVSPQSDVSVVYLVKPDNTVELRKVVVALRVQDMAGISSGLSAGDRVVVEGQGALTDKALVKVESPGGNSGHKKTETKTSGNKGSEDVSPLAENGTTK